MNHRFQLSLLLMLTALVGGSRLVAEESNADSAKRSAKITKAETPAELPKSTFVWPRSPGEGRDPFFPNSKRPYQEARDTNNVAPVFTTTAVKLLGISGTAQNPLAIINNRTFSLEEEGELTLPSGVRVSIHVREIGANNAVVEVNGQSVELKLSPRF